MAVHRQHLPYGRLSTYALSADKRYTWDSSYKICHTGLEGYIDNHNKTETDMTEEPLPGYVYGFKMPDMVFKHT